MLDDLLPHFLLDEDAGLTRLLVVQNVAVFAALGSPIASSVDAPAFTLLKEFRYELIGENRLFRFTYVPGDTANDTPSFFPLR